MKGFFTKKELGYPITDCKSCKLYEGCNTPRMKVSGKGKKGILMIGEAPGKTEDEEGVQFVGSAGDELMEGLNNIGLRRSDCWFINAVNCRPPGNRTPTKKEIKLCKPRVEQVIRKKKPRVILLLGNVALESFLSDKYKKQIGGITKWRGFVIPDYGVNAWILPAFHPSYVMRSEGIPIIGKIFRKDLKNVLKYIGKPLPKKKYYDIQIVEGKSAVVLLKKILVEEPELLAFDYETTGIKPHAEGHEIVCCGISYKENEAVVFPMGNIARKKWIEILKDRNISKTAHNMKFEEVWSREILGTKVRGWVWDSMIAAHIEDNRSGITGLKFQAYVNFGIYDYSSHLDKYLMSDENGFNKVKESPMEELLQYCGMDALLQFKLAKKQMGKES